MSVQAHPLQWPAGWPRTPAEKFQAVQAAFEQAKQERGL